MKMNDIFTKAGLSLKKASFKLKKHSPEIIVVSGVLGLIGSGILACRATLKVTEIIDETKETVDKICECAENEEFKEEYTEEDKKKDLAIIYGKTALKLAKLYAPAILLGTVSATGIFVSHDILKKRNAAAIAAYAALCGDFKKYRQNVKERYGEEVDREITRGIKAKIFANEDGTEHEEMVMERDKKSPSFSRCFDVGNPDWTKDPNRNLYFLKLEQTYAQNKLEAQGYLFLNEIYRRLGFPETPEGQLVGWLYRPNDPDHQGDNYIDFGIFDMENERKRAFLNGDETSIWLDFNVDGIVYDKI